MQKGLSKKIVAHVVGLFCVPLKQGDAFFVVSHTLHKGECKQKEILCKTELLL